MSRKDEGTAALRAEIDAERAAKAPERAKHDLARELVLLLENKMIAGQGDTEAAAVVMAGGLLPRLAALGWIHPEATPIDAILFCPICGTQHVDAANESEDWTNPPHRSHKCHSCAHIWRPADIATNGVLSIATCSPADSQPPVRGVSMCARGAAR